MKLKLTVEKTDGSTDTVPVRPRTQVAYERHWKTQLSSEIGMEQLYWLAWHSSGTVEKFDNWLNNIEAVSADVEADDDEADDIDPLAGTAPSGTSLPSPSNQGPGSQ